MRIGMDQMPGGYAWYWKNYKIADAWRTRHLSGMNGNENTVTQMCQTLQNTILTPNDAEQKYFVEEVDENDDKSDNEFEFQITDEMILFLEQSIRHKMELQQQRLQKRKEVVFKKCAEQERLFERKKDVLQKSSQRKGKKKKEFHIDKTEFQNTGRFVRPQKRCEEMKKLYGNDAAPMISGMETAMQLYFNRICDSKSPIYWPNIPFQI